MLFEEQGWQEDQGSAHRHSAMLGAPPLVVAMMIPPFVFFSSGIGLIRIRSPIGAICGEQHRGQGFGDIPRPVLMLAERSAQVMMEGLKATASRGIVGGPLVAIPEAESP